MRKSKTFEVDKILHFQKFSELKAGIVTKTFHFIPFSGCLIMLKQNCQNPNLTSTQRLGLT